MPSLLMRSAFAAAAAATPALAQPCPPQWSALGDGVNSDVYSVGSLGTGVVVGGAFTAAGGGPARHIARWAGNEWAELGGGLYAPANTLAARALLNHDDGSGPALYAAGDFTEAGGTPVGFIARWGGQSWSPLGTGVNHWVHALAEYDEGAGAALFAAGRFTTAGGAPAARIARWDGQAWAALRSGFGTGTPVVYSLAVHKEDLTSLFAGGIFTTAGGAPAGNIARWSGAFWSTLGSGVAGTVYALASFDGDLYAGGDFTAAGGWPAARIARWNGSEWSDVGPGMTGPYFPAVLALTAFDDSGPGLYAGGRFDAAGGLPANAIARWDGSKWSGLGDGLTGGLNPWVNALAVVDDGEGPALFAGGGFGQAGSVPAAGVARWGCAGPPCYPDCDFDQALTLADFGCFQTKFALGDPYADCNGDTQLNLADFGCFQTRFAVGCP